MVLPAYTMRADLTGTAFGLRPSYIDVTAYVITGPSGAPVDITGGRQDNLADVPAGTMTFILNNTDGRFTTGASIVELDHIFNFRITANVTNYDLFTGYVTSVEPTWPGGVQSWSIIKVSCVDISGKLSSAQPLLPMVQHEVLADAPVAFWPLSEAPGSSSAGDISGGTVDALVPVDSKYGAGTVTFGSDGQEAEGTSVTFVPGNTINKTTVLVNNGRAVPLTPPYSLEFWYVVDTPVDSGVSAPTYINALLAAGNSAGYLMEFGVRDPSSFTSPGCFRAALRTSPTGGGTSITGDTTARVDDGQWHHFALTVAADGVTCLMYSDGVLFRSVTAPSTLTLPSISTLQVGGYLIGKPMPSDPVTAFNGRMQNVAFFSTALSAARVLTHYQAGTRTLSESSDSRFQRIATYGGIPASTNLPSGIATMAGQTLSGQTALSALQTVARTEGTVCYPTGTGFLTFQSRYSRYDQATALSLTGDDVDPGFPIRKDLQDFFNELTANRDGGSNQRAVNATSQAGKAGRVDGGSFTVAPSSDDDAYQNAAWNVAIHSQPRTRFPSLAIDLLSRDATFQASVLALKMGSLVSLGTLPSQAPSATPKLFIEGWHYTVSAQDYSVEFFTSPQTLEGTVGQATASNSSFSATDGSMLVGF